MFALVLAMLFCVLIGAGVVGYVMLEARREGRGEFWTAEGEELIAEARRTTEKVRVRSGEIVGTAAERTKEMASRAAEAAPRRSTGSHEPATTGSATAAPVGEDPEPEMRRAS